MLKKIISATSSAGAVLALSASSVFAQSNTTTIDVDAQSAGFKITDPALLISSLLRFTLGIVGLLVFIYLIWGGIEWLTAGGDKSKTESARQKITNAIIGLAIVASAFAISLILSNFFGVSIGTNIALPSAY